MQAGIWGLVAKNMAIWRLIGQVLAVKCAGFRGLRGEIISESDANGVRGGQLRPPLGCHPGY